MRFFLSICFHSFLRPARPFVSVVSLLTDQYRKSARDPVNSKLSSRFGSDQFLQWLKALAGGFRFGVGRRRIEDARQERQPFHRAGSNCAPDVIGATHKMIF